MAGADADTAQNRGEPRRSQRFGIGVPQSKGDVPTSRGGERIQASTLRTTSLNDALLKDKKFRLTSGSSQLLVPVMACATSDAIAGASLNPCPLKPFAPKKPSNGVSPTTG